jgi:hypothetical protein
MSARETSIEVYHKVVKPMAPGLRRNICEFLVNNPPSTTSEIARALGRPRDSISPRMPELTARDLVEECDVRECDVTHQNAITFTLTGRPETKVVRKRRRPTKAKLAEIADRANKLSDAANATGDQRQSDYLHGVYRALTWALGEYEKTPTYEYDNTDGSQA